MVGATVAAALGIGARHEQSVESVITATLGSGDSAGSRQLRARARRRHAGGQAAARRVSWPDGPCHKPSPAHGAVRVGVPGAASVSSPRP
jgi:hypothetical protein